MESEELENFHNILQLDTVITYILTDRNGHVRGGRGEFNGRCIVALLILSTSIKAAHAGEGSNITAAGKLMFSQLIFHLRIFLIKTNFQHGH